MLLQYGPVNLNLLDVVEYRREAVYDGPAYQFTKFRLVVRAVYNPATQGDSWAFSPRYQPDNTLPIPQIPPPIPGGLPAPNGPPNLSPPGGPDGDTGIPGVITDVALRHLLMQPRQQLAFSVGGVYSIISPLRGFTVDAMNGPTPLFAHVHEIHGTRTWMVDYGIETCVNECPVYTPLDRLPLLLSLIWTMRHEVDEHYFAKQIVKGRAVFRADAMALVGAVPDAFRSAIILPIPFGFKRERVDVEVGEQPNIINFQVQDRQLPVGWAAAGVTKVHATHSIRTRAEAMDIKGVQAGIRGIKEITTLMSRFNTGMDVGVLEATVEGIAASINLAATGAELFLEGLPINYHTVEVEVWGSAISNRGALETFGRGIIATRLAAIGAALFAGAGAAGAVAGGLLPGLIAGALGFLPPPLAAPIAGAIGAGVNGIAGFLGVIMAGVDTEVKHFLEEKHVLLRYQIISGPILSQIDPLGTGGAMIANLTMFGPNDNTAPFLFIGGTPVGPDFDGVSRGSYTALCVGQALQTPCAAPDPPQTGGAVLLARPGTTALRGVRPGTTTTLRGQQAR